MFAIVSIMRITGVDISNQPKCENKQQFRKVLKHCKSHIHCVHIVGNDYLNYVCPSSHDAHHHSRNFVKAKRCGTNCSFEKFENTVNLICTMCSILEMII